MKNSKSIAATTTALLAAVFASQPAFAENVSGYRLDPSYNIRSEPKQDSQRFNTIGAVQDEVLKVKEISGNSKWLEIERPNGGKGYVHKNALKPVQLNPTFVIRSSPSLTAGSRIGSTSDAKRPSDLVLTGQSKVVKESNGKTIEWLGVVSKGKKGWVAAGVAKSATSASKQADQPETKPAAKKTEKPAPKVEKPAAKPENKTEKKTENKNPEVKKAEKADKPEVKKPEVAKPQPKQEAAKPEAKPATKEAAAADEKNSEALKQKPVVVPPEKKKEDKKPEAKPEDKKPEAKPEGKKPEAKPEGKKPEAKPEDKKPEAKTAPGAKPKDDVKKDEHKKEDGPECVRTKDEFAKATRLKKIYGEKYDPFVKWNGEYGSTLTPDGKGVFTVDTTSLGFLKGLPRYIHNPTQICADMKTGKPYLLIYSKKHYFTDSSANTITLSSKDGSNTYRRATTAK